MVALSQIRRLMIEARSDGVDKVARDLQGVADVVSAPLPKPAP